MTSRIRSRIGSTLLVLILCSLSLNTLRANVGLYHVLELPIVHSEAGLTNVWEDVRVTATFTSPAGRQITVGGFYHSTNRWMVRFVPDEVGVWNYSISLISGIDTAYIRSTFVCDPSNEPGFIRQHPTNPKRWVFSGSGKLFNGIGFGDCMGTARDSILEYPGIDGGYRPAGYPEGINWINYPYSQYLTAYGDAAGFNIYRFSDKNCAYSNVVSIARYSNLYDELHSRWTDTLFRALRAHGFRIYMTMLSAPVGNAADSASMSGTLRYVQYVIDRYSSFVDFWELTNEAMPDSLWISTVAGYIHAHDPYHHLVSVSWQQPSHPAVDIISPHWYGKEDVLNSDQATDAQLNFYRKYPKPVIFGEQGQVTWDSLSSTRLRGRIWSALFNEGIILFWNSSYAIDCCNQYLGWEDRRFTRVLNNFSVVLDTGVERQPVEQLGPIQVWQLRSSKVVAAYLRNDHDISRTNSGVQLQIDVPADGVGIWYDVHTGDILSTREVQPGVQTFNAPNFVTDVAFVAGQLQDTIRREKFFRLQIGPRIAQFMDVPLEQQHMTSVLVQNVGGEPITLTNGFTSSPAKNANFEFETTFPITLGPGDTTSLPIRYSVSDTGAFAVMLSISHTGSAAWENIAFSGTGKRPATVAAEERASGGAGFRVYPNPTTGEVHLENYSHGVGGRIEVYNVLGQKRLEATLATVGSDLDLHSLPAGTYYIAVVDRSGHETMQRIVLRPGD